MPRMRNRPRYTRCPAPAARLLFSPSPAWDSSRHYYLPSDCTTIIKTKIDINMSANLITLIPTIEPDELAFLKAFTKDLSEDRLQLFISLYNAKRKRSETILICCVLGFVGFAGIQRFVAGQIGMGILYFFTAGLCFIGTIVDTINHKELTFELNQKMAIEAMGMVKGF